MTKVKICGITNLEDALLSVKFGADALGFNFYEKSPRYIAPEKAREICIELPPEILKVGVFVNEDLDKIIKIAEFVSLDAVQLHGDESAEFIRAVKERFSGEVIKAVRVSENFQPEDVLQFEADAILLDAFSKQEYGGTGETFDWKIAKEVQKIFPKLYLAGGLSAKNIVEAILKIRPFAVDACSLLEEKKGKKDKKLLIDFIAIASNNSTKPYAYENIFEFLEAIKRRPSYFAGRKSATGLYDFLRGYDSAINLHRLKFDWRNFGSFDYWLTRYYRDEIIYVWNERLLRETGGDEEKAFDLFFRLLEEFKLEKEDLNNE